MTMNRIPMIPLLMAIGFALTSCTDTGVNSTPAENLRLSIKAPATVLGKVNHEVLHLTVVKILLKRIKFSPAGSDDSVDVAAGPLVVALNLSANMTEVATAKIPPGLYDRIRFTIHKPEDQEQVNDSAFVSGESGGLRFSVMINGFYHETPFTFRSRESTHQDLRLVTPVEVTNDQTVNVTLKIDPYLWFQTNGLILDPFTQTNLIDDLIKRSFAEGFRDNDRNGEPD